MSHLDGYKHADYVRRIVDACPPLTNEQRDHIACLLRPRGPDAPYVPPRVKVHYDEDGRALFTGHPGTDLLRHVELRYVKRTESVLESEAKKVATVFASPVNATRYLIDHDDLSWVMPVTHCDGNGVPTAQYRARP